MANMKNTSGRRLGQEKEDLADIQEEQQRIEAKPTHVGFVDASSRVKLVYQSEAVDESIRKERERLAEGHLLP